MLNTISNHICIELKPQPCFKPLYTVCFFFLAFAFHLLPRNKWTTFPNYVKFLYIFFKYFWTLCCHTIERTYCKNRQLMFNSWAPKWDVIAVQPSTFQVADILPSLCLHWMSWRKTLKISRLKPSSSSLSWRESDLPLRSVSLVMAFLSVPAMRLWWPRSRTFLKPCWE